MREVRSVADLPDLGPVDPRPQLGCRRALLLQGPVGPFFARLAEDLRRGGAVTTKVNFNAGDALFYRGPDVVAYRGAMAAWPAAARALMLERRIDAVYLFGDKRPIHVAALAAARELDIPVWVFEEGYLRPNYVTVERGGVNGDSPLPRDPTFYREVAPRLPHQPAPLPVGNTWYHHAAATTAYAIAKTFGAALYPRYRHHRQNNAFYGAACYVRGAWRKVRYRITERGVVEAVIARHRGHYFVLPLQVHCDAQLQHSDYPSMEALIDEIVAEFAAHAAADAVLVVKHHPEDVPFRDYRRRLRDLATRHRLGDRLVYIHDTHLPTLLKYARGVVTMNSTVGTSALHHRTPVKAMGRAVYAIPGLTHQGSLAEFLADPGAVDVELFEAFCRWLRAACQLGGSFYRRQPGSATATGLPSSVFAPPAVDGARAQAPRAD
ncbi:MAG: capsular biosynthesis protein [Kofleriaceae bacterium]